MIYIDCEKYSKKILDAAKGTTYKKKFVIVSVGDNPASQSYIRGKIKDCEYCGIPVERKQIDPSTPYELFETLLRLRCDDEVAAIILQLPLPKDWDEASYTRLIPPEKDVDGFCIGSPFRPCTPEGIVYLLEAEFDDLTGKNVLIIGRGKLVGRPLFDMLLEKNCTVTMAHSKTRDLERLIQLPFDAIVCAVGKPKFLNLQLCNAKIVVDVGVNRDENGKLCGDCWAFSENCKPDMKVTPVPRGIGLLTRAMLIEHVRAAIEEVE